MNGFVISKTFNTLHMYTAAVAIATIAIYPLKTLRIQLDRFIYLF